jgi:hypothetical protein
MWARVQKFEQAAHREVLTHYLLEFEHSTQRLQELNKRLARWSSPALISVSHYTCHFAIVVA